MRFAYKVACADNPAEAEKILNQHGADGFHCKHYVIDSHSGGVIHMILEKRLDEQPAFPPAPQGPVELHPKAPWKLWYNAQGESATVKSLQDAGLAELVKAVKAQPQGKAVVLDGLETWWTVFLGEERVHRKFKVMVK